MPVSVLPPAVTLVPDKVRLRAPMLTAPPAAVVIAPAVTIAPESSPTNVLVAVMLVNSVWLISKPAAPPILVTVAAVFGSKYTLPVVWMVALSIAIESAFSVILPLAEPPPMVLVAGLVAMPVPPAPAVPTIEIAPDPPELTVAADCKLTPLFDVPVPVAVPVMLIAPDTVFTVLASTSTP